VQGAYKRTNPVKRGVSVARHFILEGSIGIIFHLMQWLWINVGA
jgi:hypothetical protein